MKSDEANRKQPEESSHVGFWYLMTFVFLAFFMWLMVPSKPKDVPQQQHNTVSVPLYSPVSNEQIQEMRTSYNQVLSDTLRPIYAGSAIRNEHWVNVYVNSLWYELNKGQKIEVVNRCKNTYVGMLGARGIKIDHNPLCVFINFKENEKILAKWTTLGVTINE